jgi:hypothetical protein
MKARYALLLSSLALLALGDRASAQCTAAFTGQTAVLNTAWDPAVVPPTMTSTITGTTVNGSFVIAMGATVTAVPVGTLITGPNLPPGTTVTAVANPNLTLSNAATGSGGPTAYQLTLPGWANAYPPTNVVFPNQAGQVNAVCTACPSLFAVDLCANNFATMYMCAGNVYTLTLCGSAAVVNTTMTITNAAGSTSYAYDDDGCGPVNGLSTITFVPAITQAYRIRIFEDPCIINAAMCGTLEISCAPVPAPPANDNPCAAIPLPVSTVCTYTVESNSFATATSIPPPACGAYPGYDVWFSAVVPASGNLSIQTDLVSASDMAFAVYSTVTCALPFTVSVTRTIGSPVLATANTAGVVPGMRVTGGGIPVGATVVSVNPGVSITITANATAAGVVTVSLTGWTEIACNADAVPGVPEPFQTFSGLPPGSTVYIRMFPQANVAAGGTFQICAYEPVPPPNDNPCGSIVVPVLPTCTPSTYSTESATPLAATMTATPDPPCVALGGGDVWFQVTMPATGSMTISTIAGTLNNMAMAAYTLTAGALCGPGSLTQVAGACNNDATALNLMPSLTISGTAGNVYYVRVWNLTAAFGTFGICAIPNTPPPNDNPCGAISLTVNAGCLFGIYTTSFATQTATAGGVPGATWTSAPNPIAPCASAAPANDVWFTAVVPADGNLQLDTDDGLMTDASMAIYTATGTCAGNNLNLTQVAGAGGCATGGSPQSAIMPFINATGLTPGSTVYIRVWRTLGSSGNFQLCARNLISPPGICDYTLRMTDTGGDGWNGGYVRICRVPGGCTNYTIVGSTGFITFGGSPGTIITYQYFPLGGFQNQISYQILANNGFAIFASPSPPTTVAGTFTINAECNVPPAPPSDCIGSVEVCTNQVITGLPGNTGNTADLGPANRGCLSSNEVRGQWFRFTAYVGGTIAFDIAPGVPADYDWAIWGPYIGAPACVPAGPPLRCSYAAGGGPTGMNLTSADLSEGAGGDRYVRYIDALAGQSFLLYVDRFSSINTPFALSWNLGGGADINCLVLPVQMLSFDAKPDQRVVNVTWATASERNSAFFEVQRSEDANNWERIGEVAASGNTLNTTSYAFVDENPHSGLNFYRLRQVDVNGDEVYTDHVAVLFRRTGLPIEVYPNPAKESISASFTSQMAGTMQWSVMDMSGRRVEQGSFNAQNGTNRMEVNLTRVESGSYILELMDASGVLMGNTRFMKQ